LRAGVTKFEKLIQNMPSIWTLQQTHNHLCKFCCLFVLSLCVGSTISLLSFIKKIWLNFELQSWFRHSFQISQMWI
jgi:hypothetical protein